MSYKPTVYDLEWTKNLWDHLNDGGVWAYKTAPILVTRIDATHARLIVAPFVSKDDVNLDRLRAVFKALGISLEET